MDLFRAAGAGDVSQARKLLRGKDVLAQLSQRDAFGRQPLSVAVFNGHVALVEVLLDNGAEVNATDSQQRTPLHWCVSGGSNAAKVAQMLVQHGGEIARKDALGRTAEDIAEDPEVKQVVKVVRKAGPNPSMGVPSSRWVRQPGRKTRKGRTVAAQRTFSGAAGKEVVEYQPPIDVERERELEELRKRVKEAEENAQLLRQELEATVEALRDPVELAAALREVTSHPEQLDATVLGSLLDFYAAEVQRMYAVQSQRQLNDGKEVGSGSRSGDSGVEGKSNLCAICEQRPVNVSFVPCGHSMCCEPCGQIQSMCPQCKSVVYTTSSLGELAVEMI